MKQILLDTSFILTCIRQKIDFVEELKLMSLLIVIPEGVKREVQGLAKSKAEAEVAEQLFKKCSYEVVYSKSKNVDKEIIKYANENPKTIVATLDKEIQKKISNHKMIIRGKHKLEIVS